MTFKLLLITLLTCTTACTKSGFIAELGSLDNNSQGSTGNGAGSVQIQFTAPTADFIATDVFKVTLTAAPLPDLRELKLFVNGVENFRFPTVPFEVTVDPSKFTGCLLTLKAQALDNNQLLSFQTLKIKKTADCNPGDPGPNPGTNTPPSSKDAGKIDPNCMNNNSYDACLFWKNPVAQRGSSYASPVNFGNDLAEQTFGVKLNLANANRLQNSSITIESSQAPIAVPQGGSWRYAYKDDASNHFVAQLMAYFWLTYQEKQMVSRTGKFYAAGKGIVVDAYNTSVQNNAYWDTQKIVMGVAIPTRSTSHEMALSAEVYLHEMGHANLQFAVGRFLQDNNSNNNICNTQNGCIGAVNEGQADFHFDLLFYENTALGETFVNSTSGISQNGISRDVRKLTAMKVSEFYSRSGGEIHGMGSFYSSVLWEIYNDPQMLKADFEKIFTSHLQKFTESTRFPEARDILLAEDLALFGGKYKSLIQTAFQNKGVQ